MLFTFEIFSLDVERLDFINEKTVLLDFAAAADGGSLFFKIENGTTITNLFHDGKISSVNHGCYYIPSNDSMVYITNIELFNTEKLILLESLISTKYGMNDIDLPNTKVPTSK